jgi:hypothetical protein
MRSIRLGETAGCVHATVFAETAFEFQQGGPKAVSLDADFVIPRELKNSSEALAYCSSYTPPNITDDRTRPARRRPPGRQISRTWSSFCRETYARLWLHAAFAQVGGRDEDIALISDADEIPRGGALGALLQSACVPPDGVALSLAARHIYHYDLRCESFPQAAHGWIKGPVAVTGRTLREMGAQVVRTTDGCVSIPRTKLSCRGPPRWYTPNASWHLSSLSGGAAGHIAKIHETYGVHLRNGHGNGSAALQQQQQQRPESGNASLQQHVHTIGRRCAHIQGKSHLTSGIDRYEKVPLRPTYPYVPRSLERMLTRGELSYMRGFE